MTDVDGRLRSEDGVMRSGEVHPVVAIRITGRNPLEGEALEGSEVPERFVGWLGLLRVLEERLSDRGRGCLVPRGEE